MAIPIIFFSASNNTDYIAQLIAKGVEVGGLTPVLIPIEKSAEHQAIIEDARLIAIGSPIHGGFSEPIYRWLKSYDFSGKRVYLFSTAAFFFFGSSVEAAHIIKKKGGNVSGVLEVKFSAPGDGIYLLDWMVKKYPLPEGDLRRAFEFGRAIAASEKITTEGGQKELGFDIGKRIVSRISLFLLKYVKRVALSIAKRCCFRFDTKKCTGCGRCEKSCPNDAIQIKNVPISMPISLKSCFVCLRCFKACPTEALLLRGKKSLCYYRGPWQLYGYLDPEEAKTRFGADIT